MLSNRIILGAILFYPYEIILCRDAAVLTTVAGVIALSILPAPHLPGAVALIDLRHIRKAVARQGADGGGKDCRRDKL